MKKIWYFCVLLMVLSCTTSVNKPPKSYTLTSIKNKGILLDKDIQYPKQGIFIIQTKEDIVSENLGDISSYPMKGIFNRIERGDTIK